MIEFSIDQLSGIFDPAQRFLGNIITFRVANELYFYCKIFNFVVSIDHNKTCATSGCKIYRLYTGSDRQQMIVSIVPLYNIKTINELPTLSLVLSTFGRTQYFFTNR